VCEGLGVLEVPEAPDEPPTSSPWGAGAPPVDAEGVSPTSPATPTSPASAPPPATMGETPKPQALPVTMGETPKPQALPAKSAPAPGAPARAPEPEKRAAARDSKADLADPAAAPDFLLAAVADPAAIGGLAANVLRLHACASQVRERMSMDNWHMFNRLLQRLPGPQPTVVAALESIDEIVLSCVSLAGFAMDDMTRDESWRFILLGRRLERLARLASVVSRVLGFAPAARVDALEWLLEVANSIVTFRARYRRAPELLPVLHLVVFDESNPHAVAFQLAELPRLLEDTAAELGGAVPGADFKPLAVALRADPLAGFEPESGAALERACTDLAALLVRVRRAAFGLSDELQRRFFTHAGTPVPLGE